MDEKNNNNHNQGTSPIVLMIVCAVLSTLFLPLAMYGIEKAKGSSQISNQYEILVFVEEQLDKILFMPFNDIPEGLSSNKVIASTTGHKLDLQSKTISNNIVSFECFVETLPVSFSAIKNYSLHNLQKALLQNGMKKITITAKWGKGDNKQNIQLVAFKANI